MKHTNDQSLKSLLGEVVYTYRNLNKPSFFSVKHEGKVKAYAQDMVLVDVSFIGAHSKAQVKIQNGEHRSVHAYAKGALHLDHCPMLSNGNIKSVLKLVEVTYRPKERAGFFRVDTHEEVTSAEMVYFHNSKMFCLGLK